MKGLKLAGAAVIGLATSVAFAGEDEMNRPTLLPGDEAPALGVTHWVQGEEVSGFDRGQVYVVDFWATWCGPCIKAMPHLTKVQKEHPDSVTVVAVNIWEKKDLSLDDRAELVTAKVHDLGKKMKVRVAIDGKNEMSKSWMAASGSNGIPTTFIVDQAGRVAWIGHPTELDEPLEQVLAGSYDVGAHRAAFEKKAERAMAIKKMWGLLEAEEYKEFYATASAYIGTHLKDDADQLNALAWDITTSEKVKERDLDVAYRAAKRACELTEWKNPYVLDTFAHVLFAQGHAEKAVKIEKQAIEAAGEDAHPELLKGMQEALERFEGAAAAVGCVAVDSC